MNQRSVSTPTPEVVEHQLGIYNVGFSPTEAQAKVIEQIFISEIKTPTPPPEVVEHQLGIYDKMVHRETGGSDPLVQEPKT